MTPPGHAASLIDVLRHWSRVAPDRTACRFLSFGSTPERGLTYRQLDRHAAAVGAALKARAARGDRVVLLYPPGLDFVTAFLGAFHAGAIAVPVYPPDPTRPSRDLTKLRAIVADARPSLILTTRDIAAVLAAGVAEIGAPDLMAIPWLETESLELAGTGESGEEAPGRATHDDIAFLQYTSGSTGQPKGVMVSHGNVLHNVQCIQRVFEDDESSTLVSWLPLYHDMGLIGNLLHGLYVGTTSILMSPLDFLSSPVRWLETISRYRAHTSGGPNFAYELCVRRIAPSERRALDLSSWQVAFNGAEPVRRSTIERFVEAFEPSGFRREAFFPCYGLAEATLIVSGGAKAMPPTFQEVDARALERNRIVAAVTDDSGARPHALSLVGCGTAVPDHQVAIVDPDTHHRCATGTVGEIWVAGPSIAQGYWNKPEQTAATFLAQLTGSAGGSFLRTGDLGYVVDGELFVTGRLKDVVIVRGRNHYPQDIELTAELAHPALRPGCGAAFSLDDDETERLVLVHELDRKHQVTPVEDIAAAVAQSIAAQHDLDLHALVLIETGRIPKTTSGKIQRSAARQRHIAGTLPVVAHWIRPSVSPTPAAEVVCDAALPPGITAGVVDDTSAIETWLRAETAQVLNLPDSAVPGDVPLLRLGLDSLRAVELRQRIEARTGTSLSLTALLRSEDLRSLSAQLAARLAAPAAPNAVPRPLVTVPDGEIPLSFGQERLWFLAQLEPDSSSYNECLTLELAGPLRPDLLEAALRAVMRRHESLRMSFPVVDARPVVRVADEPDVALHLVDVAGVPEAGRLDEAMRHIRQVAARPFDLSQAPLVRPVLVPLAPDRHLLGLIIHHILCDGRSSDILCEELAAFYAAGLRGEQPALPALPLQYSDAARWERERLHGDALEGLLGYWRQQLARLRTSVALPADHARPAARSGSGHTLRFELPTAVSTGLRELAQREGATSFAALLAAFYALLHRYSGQDDIAVGVPVAGRDAPDAASLVGFFVNTVVMRADLAGDPSFRELVSQTGAVALEALEHQGLPLEMLAQALKPERRANQSPLFNVMFSFQCTSYAPIEAGDVTLRPLPLDRDTSQFDLTMTVTDVGDRFVCALEYDADLFEARTIEAMVEHFATLVDGAVAAPERRVSELPLLGDAERQALAVRHARTVDVRPEPCVHQQVAARARSTPDAIAVVHRSTSLTYAELDRRAGRLAARLRREGVGPDVLVGVCLERSCELIVALLAVLKAGGAYVPLDPACPDERLHFMLDDARATVVVADAALAGRLGPDRRIIAPSVPDVDCEPLAGDELALAALDPTDLAGPGHLAYVVYTSGSTGAPKGVMIEHRALAGYIAAIRDKLALCPEDRILQFTAPTFDVAAEEIFGCLTTGATLVLRTDEVVGTVEAFLRACEGWRLTVLDLPTAFWTFLVSGLVSRSLALPPSVRLVIVGGEALPPEALATWQALGPSRPVLVNAYGPTETTISATLWTQDPADTAAIDRVPIGLPLRTVDAYVLDAHRNPVPAGVAGELYLGGECLARGYLHRPELTEQRFVASPFGPGRLYRTGDLVRELPDGNLLFLGRTDQQVKIRGFRVEPGEIEVALARHSSVAEAVVLCHADRGEPTLTGYVVARPDAVVDGAELRRFARQVLPQHMVPSRTVVLERWPLTSHGKIDRRALAALDTLLGKADGAEPGAGEPRDIAGPRTALERSVAEIWRDVLGVDEIGIHDNFFDLGGHSLMATRLVARMPAAMGIELPLRTVFEAPTVAEMSVVVAQQIAQLRNTNHVVTLLSELEALSDVEVERRLAFADEAQRGE